MTQKFEVVLNRCVDTTHENDITCDFCGGLASCAIILGRRLCSTCLSMADRAIASAIYDAVVARNQKEHNRA